MIERSLDLNKKAGPERTCEFSKSQRKLLKLRIILFLIFIITYFCALCDGVTQKSRTGSSVAKQKKIFLRKKITGFSHSDSDITALLSWCLFLCVWGTLAYRGGWEDNALLKQRSSIVDSHLMIVWFFLHYTKLKMWKMQKWQGLVTHYMEGKRIR